jgi:predicted nucleotidyltransferase
MKNLVYICLFAVTSLNMTIPDSGVCVVEFNASFNSANSVDWIDDLSDCKGRRVDIVSEPALQKEHKIVVVPTVIVFNDGEEVERFQANIMMQLEATQDDVQEAVDEIIMSDF